MHFINTTPGVSASSARLAVSSLQIPLFSLHPRSFVPPTKLYGAAKRDSRHRSSARLEQGIRPAAPVLEAGTSLGNGNVPASSLPNQEFRICTSVRGRQPCRRQYYYPLTMEFRISSKGLSQSGLLTKKDINGGSQYILVVTVYLNRAGQVLQATKKVRFPGHINSRRPRGGAVIGHYTSDVELTTPQWPRPQPDRGRPH